MSDAESDSVAALEILILWWGRPVFIRGLGLSARRDEGQKGWRVKVTTAWSVASCVRVMGKEVCAVSYTHLTLPTSSYV